MSVIGNSRLTIARYELRYGDSRLCNPMTRTKICSARGSRWGDAAKFRVALNPIRSETLTSEKVGETCTSASRSKPIEGVRLYVGLPVDAVSDCNSVNHARAIAAGLKALKLLGVDGVELPIWWGIAQKEAMGKCEWTGYLALAEIVQKAGLKLHVSLNFHASNEPRIPLPEWVSQIGEAEPGIFFMDRSGLQYKDCLSISVDDLPVLNGKTPVEVYQGFCEDFRSAFSAFMGSTITGVSISLGPDGELRYPSFDGQLRGGKVRSHAGEFQCYDRNMLRLLKQHAEATGNPLWGLGAPHDAPTYHQLPSSCGFLKDQGGSWETPYGDFFLSWYSAQLLSHCDRLLSMASAMFKEGGAVRVSGKVPLMHSWYRTRSHASELTAGFYNTDSRDGYEAVADVFGRSSCEMILPGMDLWDGGERRESLSSPESLVAQIKRSCWRRGVGVWGQNSRLSGGGFKRIRESVAGDGVPGDGVVGVFTYQRMGAAFFSPQHFPLFTEFVRSFSQEGLVEDDLPVEGDGDAEGRRLKTRSAEGLMMQTA